MRTCAGCGSRDVPDALLRFVVSREPPHLAPDAERRLGGRGVSVHPRRRCLDAAVRRGGFARAIRGPVSLGVDEVVKLAADHYRRRAEGLLSSAHRSGHAAFGTDAVRAAIEARRVQLLVVAADAANKKDALEAQVKRLGGACAVLGTKASLGGLLGRDEVAVVAITEPKIARELGRAAQRAQNLTEDQ